MASSAPVGLVGRLPQVLWTVTLPLCLLVGLASFGQLLTQGNPGVLIQGPLVVDPTLAERLATVISEGAVRWSQLAIHVVGLALFVGLAITIASRSHTELSFVAASMLTAVGVSLFAPLNLLEGGWARVAGLVGEAVPEAIDNYWFSLAGILLLVFLRLFLAQRPRPWEKAILIVFAGLAIVGAIWPRASFLPSNLPDPLGPFVAASIPLVALGRGWFSRPPRPIRPVLVAMTLVALALGMLLLLRPSLQPDAFGLMLVTPRLQALYGFNTLLLSTAAVFAMPISIVLAVVRYRLFDIDVLVNRALVYGSLTALATLLFAVVSLSMSALAGGLIGSGATGAQAGQIAGFAGVVTGTALAVGMQPVRRRLQRVIDRRLYREKFDAEQALDRLVQSLASVVERPVLEERVRSMLSETLQPTSAEVLGSDQVATRASIEDAGGVLIPLAGADGLAGALAVGPRRAGIPYRGLDLRFLAQTADRVGPALRIVELFEQQEATRRQRQRVEEELSVARRIQRQLLPRTLPIIDGYQLEVFYQPAREVGGDFYDFYPFEDGRLAIAVGDATDKGVPAALVMAACRSVLRGVARLDTSTSPGRVLALANDLLVGDIPAGMFITCLYGILDPATGTFVFANAGHNPPLQFSGSDRKLVIARGMPLGLMAAMEYEERTLRLGLDEVALLTSDGITEASDATRQLFGFERLLQVEPSVDGVLAALAAFTGPVEQTDDITLIRLERTGNADSATALGNQEGSRAGQPVRSR